MNSVIAYANLVASLFVISIIIGLYMIPKEALKSTRPFRLCMWTCFAGLIAEMIAFILDGHKGMETANWVFNYLSYVLMDLMMAFYAFYFYVVISQSDEKFPKAYAYTLSALYALDACFSTIGAITGHLFTIENGWYTVGPWNDYAIIVGGINFLVAAVVLFWKKEAFGIKSYWVASLYLMIPMASFAVLVLNIAVRYGYAGASISLTVIYVIVHSRIIAEVQSNAELYNRLSVQDILTGLKNRRAYQNYVDNFSINGEVAAVFADVNSLKETNDHLGHEAGDKLIIKAADALKNAFPDGKVFRVSGDEFVCIIENATKDSFAKRMNDFAASIYDSGRILSVGYSVGEGSNVLDLVKKAEQVMYVDKSRYYKETGKDRRR